MVIMDKKQEFVAFEDIIDTNRLDFARKEQFLELFNGLKIQGEGAGFSLKIRNQSPSWIFDFVEVLGMELDKSDGIDRFAWLLELYIYMLEWLVEDSGFLLSYPEETREETRERSERMLRVAYSEREAICLMRSNACEDKEYIMILLRKLNSSHHLFDLDQKLISLSTIFRFSTNLIHIPTGDFVQLLFHAEQYDVVILLLKHLDERITALDRDMMLPCKQKMEPERAVEMTRLIAAKLLIKDTPDDPLVKASLFRSIYFASGCKVEIMRKYALQALMFQGIKMKYSWEDVIHFSSPDFLKKILGYTSYASMSIHDHSKMHEGDKGKIVVNRDNITLMPRAGVPSSFKENDVPNNTGVILKLYVKKKIEFNTWDFAALSRGWKEVFNEFLTPPKKVKIGKERPEVGDIVRVQIKNFHPTMSLIVFVRIVADHFEGEGILHVKQVTRIKLDDLREVFEEGNTMFATVIESTPDKLSFSIIEELGRMVGVRFHVGEWANAMLLSKRVDLLTWISEDGYSLYTLPDPNEDILVGACHSLMLTEVNTNGYVKARVDEPLDFDIDIHEAVANLIYNYMDDPEITLELMEKERQETCPPREEVLPLPLTYVPGLFQALDLFTVSRVSRENLNLLYFLKLVCRVMNNDDLEEFYGRQIDFMMAVNEFVQGNKVNVTDVGITCQKYPTLMSQTMILNVLSAWNVQERNGELIEIADSEHPVVVNLAKLVLSNNFLGTTPFGAMAAIKDEIVSSLADLPDQSLQPEIVDVHFGIEDNNREFKTTIVFPPESTGEANFEKQFDTIARTINGFLNGEGGVLYIGVNNLGNVSGINADLNAFRCDEDKYQLIIRQKIVEIFGEDINGLITLKFRDYGLKSVCAIAIPSYHKEVPYGGVYWQRQGNATRPIKGNNLKLLKQRKKAKGLSYKADIPLFPGDPNYDRTFIEENKKAGVNRKGVMIEKQKITTRLGKSSDGKAGSGKFFSILDSRLSVVSTRDLSVEEDCLLSIPVPEKGRDMVLVQVNTKGSVHCTSVEMMEGKELDVPYPNDFTSDGDVMFSAFCNVTDFLYLKTALKTKEHVKLVPVSQFSSRQSVMGGVLFTTKFDSINHVNVLTAVEARQVSHLVETNPGLLGIATNTLTIIRDILYCDGLFKT